MPLPWCYTKATSVGRRFSEGGTHEETLRPQDLKRGKWGSRQTVDGVIDNEDGEQESRQPVDDRDLGRRSRQTVDNEALGRESR